MDSQLNSDRFSFFYFLDWTSESRETTFLVRLLLNWPRPIEELPPPIGGRHRLLCFMTNIKATNMKNTAGKSARFLIGVTHMAEENSLIFYPRTQGMDQGVPGSTTGLKKGRTF